MYKFTCVFIAALLVSPLAQANTNAALMELLKALEENGTINSDIYDMIINVASQPEQRQVAQTDKEAVKELVKKEVAAATSNQPVITVKEKFEVKDKNGDFSFRVGGRIQADAATYSEDVLDHNDGTEMRRARLFAQGTMWKFWQYKLQYDFVSTGNSGIADAYIRYSGYSPWQFTFGHFKQAFSLQNMTSSKYVTFTERGLPHVFTPGRAIGFNVGRNGNNWSSNIGLFGEGIDGASGTADEGYAVTGRLTYAPVLQERQHLHLGVSASYRDSGIIDALSFSDRPESHVTNTREINTGSFNADHNTRTVMEAAYTFGPASVQGEYYLVDIGRDGAGADLDFSGYYLEGSWFITDDHRNYSGSKGSYGKIKPGSVLGKGGLGAWQLAVRFSSVDLNDSDISGGDARNLTLGMNWFPTNNTRMTANYVKVLDVEGGPSDGDEPEAFQLRGQIEF
ncbi:MAG: porin [Gammaproteobacteria bacterium]